MRTAQGPDAGGLSAVRAAPNLPETGWVRAFAHGWTGTLAVGLIAYAAAFCAWVAFDWGGDAVRLPLGDLAYFPVNLAAVLLALRAARSTRREAHTRRAWHMMAAAFACLLIADGLWAYFELVAHTAPFPSFADPFYLAFYPIMLAGVLWLPVARRRSGEAVTFALDSATVLLGAGMVVWYFVLRPTALAEQSGALAAALSLAYPVGDLVLIFAMATVLLRHPDVSSRASLAFLVSGITLFVIGDTGYGHQALAETYEAGDWPDAAWMTAQVLLALSAHIAVVASRRGSSVARNEERTVRPFSMLPYVAILIGYGLLFAVARPQSHTALGGLIVGAVAITGMVLARQVRVLRENARLLRELEALARTDELTGLLTRRSFYELAGREWSAAARYDRPLCTLAIDVDRFKQINDSFGHGVGDTVLAGVAERLQSTLRETDVLGRLGGDEFVAVLPDTTVAEAQFVVERLRVKMRDPINTSRGPVPVTISVGIAPATGSSTLPGAMERADSALYVAKETGRDRVHALAG